MDKSLPPPLGQNPEDFSLRRALIVAAANAAGLMFLVASQAPEKAIAAMCIINAYLGFRIYSKRVDWKFAWSSK